MQKNNEFHKVVNRVGIITIIWNLVLAGVKMVVGLLARSEAMVSDAVHSASDIFTTVIVIIGAKISSKESDAKHPYGHERFESIASMFLALILAMTALGIGYSGIKNIIAGDYLLQTNSTFVLFALGGAVLSIVVKGFMFIYTNNVAKKIRSNSLKADAWHHLSDSLSSVGSMLGIIGLMIGHGWQVLDPIAATIICLVILKVAFDIMREAIDQLVDESIPKSIIDDMLNIAKNTEGIIEVCSFKSRQFSNKMYVDFEIYVKNSLSIIETNEISEKLHVSLEGKYKNLKHCTVWAKPYFEDIEKSG